MNRDKMGQQAAGLFRYGELLIALAVTAMGLVVLWHARGVEWSLVPLSFDPLVVPIVIGLAQVSIGLWYAMEIVNFHGLEQTRGVRRDADAEIPSEWLSLTIFGMALLAYTLLIHRSGFVIASVVLLVLAAFGMGSRRIVRDVSCAVVASAGLFLVLDTWLGMHLPEGWLAGVI